MERGVTPLPLIKVSIEDVNHPSDAKPYPLLIHQIDKTITSLRI
jgi:hypothetical protein